MAGAVAFTLRKLWHQQPTRQWVRTIVTNPVTFRSVEHVPENHYNYDKGPQRSWFMERLGYLENVSPNRSLTVLDVGSGDGELTRMIADSLSADGGKTLGIEHSAELVDFASKKYAAPNCEFKRLAVDDVPTLDQKFDLITSYNCLHWHPNHEHVVENFARVLNKGGRINIFAHGEGSMPELLANFELVITSERWAKYFKDFKNPFHFYPAEDWNKYLLEAGFSKIEHCTIEEHFVHHEGNDGLRTRLVSGWWPWISVVPDDYRDEFLNDYIDYFRANFHQNCIKGDRLVSVNKLLVVDAVL
eukprot:Clim_evm5s172 gene=Clim_evmTU5s172